MATSPTTLLQWLITTTKEEERRRRRKSRIPITTVDTRLSTTRSLLTTKTLITPAPLTQRTWNWGHLVSPGGFHGTQSSRARARRADFKQWMDSPKVLEPCMPQHTDTCMYTQNPTRRRHEHSPSVVRPLLPVSAVLSPPRWHSVNHAVDSRTMSLREGGLKSAWSVLASSCSGVKVRCVSTRHDFRTTSPFFCVKLHVLFKNHFCFESRTKWWHL